MTVLERDGRVVYVTPAFERITGFAADAAKEPAQSVTGGGPQGVSGTVLVVEDERSVHELIARVLRRHGYLREVEELNGRIWRRVVTTGELDALEQEHAVISTRLLAGRTIAHVFANASPGADFEAVEPDLKDVYFSVMAGSTAATHRT